MGTFSDYTENKLLDHVLKTTSFTVPTDIYIALSTADPTDDGSGIAEPVGNSYARVAHNVWNAAAARLADNNGIVTFPTATGSWGTITHFAIFDAITSGNFLGGGAFTVQKVVNSGNTATIASGEMDVSFTTGGISTYLSNALIDHILKTTSFTVPTNVYVGLSTADPTDDGSGIAEPSASYARVIHNVWDAAAAGATENTGTITFPSPSGSWGTVTHNFLSDAASSGNMLFYGALTQNENPNTSDTVSYADGALDITMD